MDNVVLNHDFYCIKVQEFWLKLLNN